MPFKKPPTPYKPLFENYVCCVCFKTLEEDNIHIDETGQKWDVCKECDKIEKDMKKAMEKSIDNSMKIGKYKIYFNPCAKKPNSIFIKNEIGEGMETTISKLESVIDEFFEREL